MKVNQEQIWRRLLARRMGHAGHVRSRDHDQRGIPGVKHLCHSIATTSGAIQSKLNVQLPFLASLECSLLPEISFFRV